MSYTVFIKKSAQRGLAKITKRLRENIARRIDALGTDPRPHGMVVLKGHLHGSFRIRVGDFRVVYDIDDETCRVLIVMVRDRKEVYR